jgi:hypothetical protein
MRVYVQSKSGDHDTTLFAEHDVIEALRNIRRLGYYIDDEDRVVPFEEILYMREEKSMSRQWSPENTQQESVSCFPRILAEASDRAALRKATNKLLPDEVKIVAAYVENVLKTRPRKAV